MLFTHPFRTVKTEKPEPHSASSIHIPMVYEKIDPASWEYHVLRVDSREESLPEEAQLNALGQEGWLLVSIVDERVTSKGGLMYYYFVRQKQG